MTDLVDLLPEEAARELQAEFEDWLREKVDELVAQVIPRDDGSLAPGVARLLMVEVHNIKGSAGSFGFSPVSMIAHRLEDCLARMETDHQRDCRILVPYLDAMQAWICPFDKSREEEFQVALKSLPFPGEEVAGEAVETAGDGATVREALIVTPTRLLNDMLRMGLKAHGWRAISTSRGLEGLALATRMRPDLVIASAVMDDLDGVDLARGLRSMLRTGQIPVMLISSLPPDHPKLKHVPQSVPVLRYGPELPAAFNAALEQLTSALQAKG